MLTILRNVASATLRNYLRVRKRHAHCTFKECALEANGVVIHTKERLAATPKRHLPQHLKERVAVRELKACLADPSVQC